MNEDVVDRRGSEGVWLTHPLRHEALPPRLRRDPVMSGALVLLAQTRSPVGRATGDTDIQ